MGSTRHHHLTRRRALSTVTIAGLVALAGCAGSDEDASSRADGSADTAMASEATVTAGAGVSGDVALTETDGETAPMPGAGGSPMVQAAGQSLAIEARAALQADDVRATVDQISAAATTRGGRVAAADIDLVAPTADQGEGHAEGAGDSRATLVLSIPPDELPAMVDALEALGTLTSFDQLAEDVTEQLTDLETRIANMRASVERVRVLLAEAVDIDGIVRLEAELTTRETELERLLASERQLDDRVAMSTLTVDVTTTPGVVDANDDPGIVDALAAGWDAFTGGLYRIVVVLAAAAPFVVAAAALGLVALWGRHVLARRRPPTQPVSPPTTV